MWGRGLRPLQERISSLFYAHGLFCASHPVAIITLVIGIVILTWYPLTKIPLPVNAPQQFNTPILGYEMPPSDPPTTSPDLESDSERKTPRWYYGPPAAYIQQIIVKVTVSPWQPRRLIQTDAFRAPLLKSFEILEQINRYQLKSGRSSQTVSDICVHVAETLGSVKARGVLPEYSCLTLSPANFWNQDKHRFSKDGQVIKTIFKDYGPQLNAPPPIKDILFGLPMKDTGVKRFYLRNRQRIISFAVTLFLKDYNPKFIAGLRDVLNQRYPLSMLGNHSEVEHLVHIHYKDVNYFVEYTPLIISYVFLFLYLYFSVRKIEMVKSKWGLALSAVFTVVASLTMSIGLCTLVGLAPSLSGSEIFPYLVIIVGLENVLVVTKSVVSTPVHLDVKLRVAQGISKEGWYIFKNLIAELLVLTVGFFTFVPAIQEFCLFAVVGLLSDFFLQMFFFVTVLSVDIRRLELSDLHNHSVQQALQGTDSHRQIPPHTTPQCPFKDRFGYASGLHVDTSMAQSWGGQSAPPSPTSSGVLGQDGIFYFDPSKPKMPRRVKLMNTWARWRFAQRGIMVCVVIWILLIMYKSGLVEHLAATSLGNLSAELLPPNSMSPVLEKLLREPYDPSVESHDDDIDGSRQHVDGAGGNNPDEPWGSISSLVQHKNMETWRELSHIHWPTILSYYNISLQGRYLTILPSVGLSAIITPDEAVTVRHPIEEQAASHVRFHSDQLNPSHTSDVPDKVIKEDKLPPQVTNDNKLPTVNKETVAPGSPVPPPRLDVAVIMQRLTTYPRTTKELVVTVLLSIASLILMTYCLTALYRCVCSRNYAKWRSSWSKQKSRKKSPYYKQIRESVPLVLEGHVQDVECLTTDGPLVVSSCLAGKLMVWDSQSGECISIIDRKSVAVPDAPHTRTPAPGRNVSDSDADLYAEFHEVSTKPSTPPLAPVSGSHGNRHSYPRPKSKRHTRARSADFHGISLQDIAPDLSCTIDTNFSVQAVKAKRSVSENQMPPVKPDISPQNPLHTSRSVPQMTRMVEPTSGVSDKTPRIVRTASSGACSGDVPALDSSGRAGFFTGTPPQQGFDFSQFEPYYQEHRRELAEKREYWKRHLSSRSSHEEEFDDLDNISIEEDFDEDGSSGQYPDHGAGDHSAMSWDSDCKSSVPPIWCLACHDNLVVVGSNNGRIEFWDGLTGALKCMYHTSKVAVTCLCFINHRVIAARLNGTVDFLELETFTNQAVAQTTKTSTVQKRGHVRRLSSQGGSNFHELKSWDDEIHCTLSSTTRAHQQPVNLLQCAAGRVVTASQDHTLKVFRLEDSLCLYTLHGHSGNVTALHLDKVAPLAAASGSEDGCVRLWDLLTGACVHKLHGHKGTVTAVTCTTMYVVSAGLDDRMCIWERCKGRMLHWIQMTSGYCNSLCMLTSNLLVTGGQGCLYLWDLSKGEVLRVVRLGDDDHSVFIRQLHIAANSTVVCDYGPQLRLIHFPAVLEKAE